MCSLMTSSCLTVLPICMFLCVHALLTVVQVQLVQLDASLKAKAAQVERLSRLLDSNRAAEYERWVEGYQG